MSSICLSDSFVYDSNQYHLVCFNIQNINENISNKYTNNNLFTFFHTNTHRAHTQTHETTNKQTNKRQQQIKLSEWEVIDQSGALSMMLESFLSRNSFITYLTAKETSSKVNSVPMWMTCDVSLSTSDVSLHWRWLSLFGESTESLFWHQKTS